MNTFQALKSASWAKLSIVALLATTLVTLPGQVLPAKAAGPIQHDNNVCDLTTASDLVYPISTAEELWEVTDCAYFTTVFRLQNDIDLQGVTNAPTVSPIGIGLNDIFLGTLDGQNFSITGISISSNIREDTGLFSRLHTATVKNLTLSGTVTSTGSKTGGLAGSVIYGSVTLSNITSNVAVSGTNYVGGLIGDSNVPVAGNNLNLFGSVVGGDYVGGLLGEASNVYLADVRSEVTVDAGGSSVGGFIGRLLGASTISNSVNSGEVTGGAETGGLLGKVTTQAIISNSTNNARVSGSSAVGGVVGSATTVSFDAVTNSGLVIGADYVGGLLGWFNGSSSTATFSDSVNTRAVSGASIVGGLLGFANGVGNSKVIISSSRTLGSVATTGNYSGGLVGQSLVQVSIYRSFNADASVSGSNYVGGLVGQGTTVELNQVFNSGSVTGENSVGGLIGQSNPSASIRDSYNSGSVSGTGAGSSVGGLAGAVEQDGVTITNSHQVGIVTNGDALIGAGTEFVSLTSVYTNASPSSWAPITTTQALRNQATYVGWDIPQSDIWGFVSCAYPRLKMYYEVLGLTQVFRTDCLGGTTNNDVESSGTPAPSYDGPTLASLQAPVQAGTNASFSGTKLDQVTEASLGTVVVQIVSKSFSNLVIAVPAGTSPGTYDLAVISAYGKLTVIGAITVFVATEVVDSEPTRSAELVAWRWTRNFVGNSRSLSPVQTQAINAAVTANPTATTVVCWGYTTAAAPNDWAIAHATARAQAACDAVLRANPALKTAVRVRYGEPKLFAMRAALQFWR